MKPTQTRFREPQRTENHACYEAILRRRIPSALAQFTILTGEGTAVALDQGGIVGGATLAEGSISFPIAGGNLTYFEPGSVYPYVVGGIKHEGSGLSLTAGATTVELVNFFVDPGTSMLYGDALVNGTAAATDAYLFHLDGSTLNPLETSGSQAVLQGTTVEMSADAAALLNQTFNTDAHPPDPNSARRRTEADVPSSSLPGYVP